MAISDVKFTSRRREVEKLLQLAVKRSLEICGGKAETYAKKIVHVDTALLKNSITHAHSGQAFSVQNYHADRAEKSGSYSGIAPGSSDDNTMYVGTNVTYAPYLELGHHTTSGSLVPAYPFIKPALADHVSEYKKVMETELGKVGKGGVSVTIEALKD